METIAQLAAKALAATPEPSTTPANMVADWKFVTDLPERAEAVQACVDFLASIAAERSRIRAENAASRQRYDDAVQIAVETHTRIPDAPRPAKPNYRWLTLLGRSGRGKTHLARCTAETQPNSLFYRWIDLLERFRGDSDSIPRFMARCEETKLMVIDDIGSGHETAFAASMLCQIAERRLGRPTVFTANLSLENIAAIDVRIASRMRRNGSVVFEFKKTPDFDIPKP